MHRETGSRAPLTAILVTFLVLAALYNWITPVSPLDSHNPDENAHVRYVRAVAAGRLPILRADRLSLDGYEAHQPPLYYALCAPVYLAAGRFGPTVAVRAMRGVSTLLGALTVLAVFAGVRTLFPRDARLALGAAGFAALLPMHVALVASVTNDALADLGMAVGFWQLATLATTAGPGMCAMCWTRRALGLGLVLGLGAWTKSVCLPLFLAAPVAFVLIWRERLAPPAVVLRAGALCLGTGVLLASGWLLRNQILYGDPLAQRAFVQVLGATHINTPASSMVRFFGGPLPYVGAVAQWTQASFWGGFDSMRLFWGQPPGQPHPDYQRAPGPLYGLLLLACAGAVLGLLRALRPGVLTAAQQVTLRCGGVMIFAAILFLCEFNRLYFQAQGRFLFPALAPLALGFVLGWRGWFPQDRRYDTFLAVSGAALLFLNLYTIFGLLLPRFHPV